METENCGVRGGTGGAGPISDFVFGFFGSHFSGNQRFVIDRAVYSASPAHATVCADGFAGIVLGMCAAVFYCAQGRRSIFPAEDGSARGRDQTLGGAEWIWRNAGRSTSATADSIQVFCLCGWSFRGAVDELHFGDLAGPIDALFWGWVSGGKVWGRRAAFAGAA